MANSYPKILRRLMCSARILKKTISGHAVPDGMAYQNELAAKSSEDLAAWMGEVLACLPDRSEFQEFRLTKPKFRLTQQLDQELLVVIRPPFFPPPQRKDELVEEPFSNSSPKVSPSTVGLFRLNADGPDHTSVDLGGLSCTVRRRASSSA